LSLINTNVLVHAPAALGLAHKETLSISRQALRDRAKQEAIGTTDAHR